jgi:DNA primase
MNYRGRQIDPVSLWEKYVEFPPNMEVDEDTIFLPKVVCPNPEHDTNKRHFQINVREGLVHCFAFCGISGTFTRAISLIEGCSEREARKLILRNSRAGGYKLHRKAKRNSRANAPVLDLRYDRFLPPVGAEYLAERGINSSSIAAWELGWDAEEKRVVIPAKDENGHMRFLIRRAVLPRQEPKYLYTEGFPKTSLLFGGCAIDPGMIRSSGMILVEGSIDAIRLHQHGFHNAVGILGTGISKEQRGILGRMRPNKLFLMFDKDSAGIHNIEICAKTLRKYPMFVCRYPRGKSDPAELSREEVRNAIDKSIPLYRFMSEHIPNARRKVG